MEERKKTQVADMDRGVYDIKNNFEYSYIADAGLTEDIIREIWSNKNEPEWMLDFRLKSLSPAVIDCHKNVNLWEQQVFMYNALHFSFLPV